MLVDVAPVLEKFVADDLLRAGRAGFQGGNAVNDITHQMKAIQIIHHHHIKRGRGRTFLLVSAHVQILVVRAPVSQPVDQPGIGPGVRFT